MTTVKQPSLLLKKSTIAKFNENSGIKGGVRGVTDSELTQGGGRSCAATVE